MPLLDHFHPPLSQRRQWESFHGAWAEALAIQLNQDLLPDRYFAEARVNVGPQVEIDVGTFDEEGTGNGQAEVGVAVWAPPRPVAVVPLALPHMDLIEVRILNEESGPRVVAAVELVSPANKDRAKHRRALGMKCASYLNEGVHLLLVDVVTSRAGNFHADMLQLLEITIDTPARSPKDLYAASYRVTPAPSDRNLEMWVEPLALGAGLPTLALWIGDDRCVPLDLDKAYQAACAARRINP
jgi:hypothetical protein